ncbi:MAG TPA: DivIVA domain-containing protein [Ilumatobacteraceae bacterium]|nr:DivIVA domain-containing protein [Ilumatobacteraceae bacterium]
MAMSFSRPDPSSPASVADAGFNTSRRGYDQAEVRDFLRMIAAELGRLQERERFLERELRSAQTNPDLDSAQLDDAALTRLLGEETARVLVTARESGVEIRQKAESAAAQMLSEAADEAMRMREEAGIEASRRRTDAASDAEAELAMAKQQGREMVNEARAYRERVLSELARRRELAREQIEQLLLGRDRLMQSFERARLVAIEVVAELQPLVEPDEYVNLAPTTGPVPVMVPNSPRPAAGGPEAATEVAEALVSEMDETAVEEIAVEEIAVDEIAVDEIAVDDAEMVGVDAEVDAGDVEVDAVEVETDAVEVEAGDVVDDDVVVDLFARLRAEAVTIEPADDDDLLADVEVPSVDESEVVDTVDVVDSPDSEGAPESLAANDTVETVESTPFEQRDADLTPLIVGAARKLKRVLADEQNEVLETLRRNEPVRALDALLPSAADHLARYGGAISDDLVGAAQAGATLVAPTGSGPLRKGDVAAATKAANAVLGEWLVEPLRDRLERCVLDGDGDNAGISKRVRAIYREWKTQHIDEQLDDVIRTAHGRGILAGIGTGTAAVWICDPTHQGCSDCDDNSLAGSVKAGEAFPTGHLCAPAHVGCRCILLPDGR